MTCSPTGHLTACTSSTGGNTLPDGTNGRHIVFTVDILDVAKSKAMIATAVYNYCHGRQFGGGTVRFAERRPVFEPVKPSIGPVR